MATKPPGFISDQEFEKLQKQGKVQDTPGFLSDTQVERIDRQDQGQSVSVNQDKAAPSFGGSILRSIVKPVARVATNIANIGQTALGVKNTEPFSGDYLGKVKAVGTEGDNQTFSGFSKNVLDAVGVGLDLGSTVATGGGGAGIVEQGAKGAFKEAVKVGAKEGALAGATAGAGSALQEDKIEPGKVVMNTIAGTLGGATLGAVFAGLDNGVIKALSMKSGFLPEVKNQLLRKEAQQVTAPVLSAGEQKAAITRGGVTRSKIGGKVTINPSAHDLEVADAAAGIVRASKPLEVNKSAIEGVVTQLNDSITEEVAKHPGIFNENQLRSQLNKAKQDSRIIFGSDKTLENRYDDVINEFISKIDKKNLSGVFQARKDFDKIVQEKFPRVFDGTASDNVVKNAILDVRRAANDYIGASLPKGNPYKEVLKKESLLLEGRDNIVDQLQKQVGTTRLERFFRTPNGGIVKVIVYGGLLGGIGSVIGGKVARAGQ